MRDSKCYTCRYCRPIASVQPKSDRACHYLLDTGKQKGHQEGPCKVYERKKKEVTDER